MKKIAKQIRQGDVLVHPIEKLPDGVLEETQAEIVLAEGEVTGHSHKICAKRGSVKRYTKDSEVYLEVKFPVTLSHEEHAPLTIEPGVYQVRRQVEQWMDEVRQVAD
jgi:hypothetical protein